MIFLLYYKKEINSNNVLNGALHTKIIHSFLEELVKKIEAFMWNNSTLKLTNGTKTSKSLRRIGLKRSVMNTYNTLCFQCPWIK